MNNNGWIKIHRSLLDWEWYDDYKVFKLFLHLLLKANHEPKKYRGKIIDAGCLITGRELLSVETGMSVRSIRTALNKLKTTNEIAIKTTSKGTHIQIVKYKEYQITTSETTNKRPTNDQQTTTNKNIKKEKNINIPEWLEFLNYAIEKKPRVDHQHLKLKYNAWKENGWKDGNNKPIKNWKSKLSNTLPYINEQNNKPINTAML